MHHPLEQSMFKTIYAEWLMFFQSEAKHQYGHDPVRHDGYFSPTVSETAKNHTKRDLKEFFHIYPWGRYPGEVSDTATRYYQLSSQLAEQLLAWVDQHSPADVKARYAMPLPAPEANRWTMRASTSGSTSRSSRDWAMQLHFTPSQHWSRCAPWDNNTSMNCGGEQELAFDRCLIATGANRSAEPTIPTASHWKRSKD